MPAQVETMFSARVVPWHGIGTVTEGCLTARDAIAAAGLDWTVIKIPYYVNHADLGPSVDLGNGVTVSPVDHFQRAPGHFAIVRSSDKRVLGHVREDYTPFQNVDAFTFADNLVDSSDAQYETAGSLKGGRWVWVMLKLPQQMLVAGHDAHDMYLLVLTSHDGSRAITAAVVLVRVVCVNTLNLALAGARQVWRIQHIATAGQRVQEARDALRLSYSYGDTFNMRATELANSPFSEADLDAFLLALLPDRPRTPEVAGQIKGLFLESKTLENVRGSRWAALNAVGEYFSWEREPRTAESRVLGELEGVAYKMRNRALELLAS